MPHNTALDPMAQILRIAIAANLDVRGTIMKILFGYDGSRAAENALEDLKQAGFSGNAEVEVISVAESRLDPKNEDTARDRAIEAKQRLTEQFGEKVGTKVSSGTPGYEILYRAGILGADLIVIGEDRMLFNDHSMFLKSTSDKVLREAECSVRISRGNPGRDSSPTRIVIGYDGSAGSNMAVEAVCNRQWPSNSQVRLMIVTDSSVLESIGRFSPQMMDSGIQAKIAGQWASTLAAMPLQKLRDKGLDADFCFESGNPKKAIVTFAESWNADCIFVGPHCHGNSFERYLIGSVSAAVAARAHCSVEVVRTVKTENEV